MMHLFTRSFRKTLVLFLASFFLLQSCAKQAGGGVAPVQVTIEKNDGELDKIIAADTKWTVLGEGYTWSEGPVWIEESEMLLFSDVPNNTVYSWKENEGAKVYLKPSGYTGGPSERRREGANGLLRHPDGRLVLSQHGDRRMAVMDASFDKPAAVFTTLADNFMGKRFNSPNDAAYHPNGTLFFTDPFYGLQEYEADPEKELRYQGLFSLKSSGLVALHDSTLRCPNGVALSPDGKTLYLANSDPDSSIWKVFDVDSSGTLQNGRLFFDSGAYVRAGEPGLPDGLKVHSTGVIFATGPGGVFIFNPDGKLLGRIRLSLAAANCALDEKRGFLYVTATNVLLRIKLAV